jgi:hypothetical protein
MYYSPKIYFLVFILAFWRNQTFSQSPKLLNERLAYYPRAIKLSHNGAFNGRIITSFDSGNTGVFFESTDNGNTWSANPVGSITENTKPRNCCSGFYEVPQQLGDTQEGTLFWATSVGTDIEPRTTCSIRLYKSTNQGRNWSFLSTVVSGKIGLWEPEFAVDSQGRLVCYFSSEEYKPTYNQLIAHRVSTDGGLTWGNDVIDVGNGNLRPGMPVVRKLPNDNYIMSYEICGKGCDQYFRISTNGYEWGDATDLGTRIESTKGNHFSHAPTMTWFNDGTPHGKLLAIGQTLKKNIDNSLAEDNGLVFMINTHNGQGDWVEMPVPVPSPNDGSEPCRNYSSQLLPINSSIVLELALKKNANNECRLYYNSGVVISKK